jgi:hypothetical protein
VLFYFVRFGSCFLFTEFTNSDKEKANVLAGFFTSVFTIEGDGEMPDIEKVDVPLLETMIIIKDKVKKKLDKSSTYKSKLFFTE